MTDYCPFGTSANLSRPVSPAQDDCQRRLFLPDKGLRRCGATEQGALVRMTDNDCQTDQTGQLASADSRAPWTSPKVIVSDLGDVVLRDSTAGSAGVIAMRLLSELGVAENDLPTPLATALFVSLVEDTGWFRYPNSNPEVFRLAQVAIAAGVKTWEVALLLDEQLSEASLRLLALVLPTLERHCGGKLALLSLTDQMLRDAQATMDDVLKLVNYARALRGVWVGGQITVSDDRMYVSLRGKGEVHVGQLAARFGGGGHHNAAGCTIAFDDPKDVPTSLAKAKARLIAACEEVMGSGDA